MAQFGAGSQLAAQCPIAPTPEGWKPWLPEADGPIPDGLAERAHAIAADLAVPLGATESYPLPGVTTLIRVEPRAWRRDDQGNLVQGCFRVGGIFLPSGAAPGSGITPPSTGLDRTIGILTALSLVVGTAATLATWRK